MKAFRLRWPKPVRAPNFAELEYRFELPRVHCVACGKTLGDDYGYPAFQFNFLNKKEFNLERVVNLAEFDRIRNRILRAVGRPVLIFPGGGIGELFGKAGTTKLDDFVWGRVACPQISRRAWELLANEGIDLLTAKAFIRYRGKEIDSHLALQAEPAVLLTPESLSRHAISHCPVCGDYDPQYPKPRVPEGYRFARARWPKGKALVTVAETLDVLASDQFMDAVKKHNLNGIRFEECGQYV